MRVDISELLGDAHSDAMAVVDSWRKPQPAWPEGTTIERVWSSYFNDGPSRLIGHPGRSRYHLVTMPGGVQLITLTQTGRSPPDEDQPWADGNAPHLAFSYMVETRSGEVTAHPRVCNMSNRKAPGSVGDAWAEMLSLLGLPDAFIIGSIGRRLQPVTRTETEGWR